MDQATETLLDRYVLVHGRVYVYWNLHKNVYSVRKRKIVQLHATQVQLRDVTFKVSEAGRQRVIREKRKNVHAGLQGTWVGLMQDPRTWKTRGWRRVTYDPYRSDHFFTTNGNYAVVGAKQVVGKTVNGRARLYARGLEYA